VTRYLVFVFDYLLPVGNVFVIDCYFVVHVCGIGFYGGLIPEGASTVSSGNE